jgi:hypothetical protein
VERLVANKPGKTGEPPGVKNVSRRIELHHDVDGCPMELRADEPVLPFPLFALSLNLNANLGIALGPDFGHDHPDLRLHLDGPPRLEGGSANLDAKAVEGSPPWLRLRIGDYRVLYRSVDEDRLWVERLVHHGDLDKAVASLES